MITGDHRSTALAIARQLDICREGELAVTGSELDFMSQELLEQGVGCIELCGAFGPDGARRIIEATGNRIPVGYVTHLPEQEAVYRAAFPND